MEEDRQEKLKQLLEAKERQKREKEENKLRRIQLAESCEYFKSEININEFPKNSMNSNYRIKDLPKIVTYFAQIQKFTTKSMPFTK